jgi:hypothetical protein
MEKGSILSTILADNLHLAINDKLKDICFVVLFFVFFFGFFLGGALYPGPFIHSRLPSPQFYGKCQKVTSDSCLCIW